MALNLNQVNIMNTYEQIQNYINELKINASEELMEQLNILHDQLNRAGNGEWSTEDLSDYIKSTEDILDSGVVDEETALWSDIRNIQDTIISFYGSSKKQ